MRINNLSDVRDRIEQLMCECEDVSKNKCLKLFCRGTGRTGGLYYIDERVRKLTPLECWRLMGFSDEDFYKAKGAGISDTQLYKEARK